MSATTEQLTGSIGLMNRSSLALDNLRAFVILLVLSFHSVLAYLQFLPAEPFSFDSPPICGAPFRLSTAIGGSASTCIAPGKTSF